MNLKDYEITIKITGLGEVDIVYRNINTVILKDGTEVKPGYIVKQCGAITHYQSIADKIQKCLETLEKTILEQCYNVSGEEIDNHIRTRELWEKDKKTYYKLLND